MKVINALLLGLCLLYFWLPAGVSSDGANARGILTSAHEKFKNESFSDAIDLSSRARNIDSSLLDAWYLEAESYYMLKKYKESDELCDKVLRDQSFEGKGGLDRFAKLAGDCNVAYEKATGKPIVNLGSDSNKAPEADQQALSYYNKAIELNPNSTGAWNNEGVLLYELGNFTNATYCFGRALQINSSLAEAWNNKGASLARLGRHDEALKCYDNATMLDSNFAEAWYNKVKTLSKLKDEALNKGKALKPELIEEAEEKWFLLGIS